MKAFKCGSHRLIHLDGRISLSKTGYIQSVREGDALAFDVSCIRLKKYYDDNGDDFLADSEFVGMVLYGEV